jgi:rRNA processing protein Gar1
MERGQFTFFRSYWEALQTLPKKERLAAYEAICDYALNGTVQEMTGSAATAFILIKPTLDSGRKKAASGKHGGENGKGIKKQTESKPKAKAKQPKREKEREKEKEREIENECYARDAFETFWKAYPRKVGKDAARRAFAKVKVPVETLVAAVEAQKASPQWTKDNGQFIPNPATWLNQGRWEDEVKPANPEDDPNDRYAWADEYMQW